MYCKEENLTENHTSPLLLLQKSIQNNQLKKKTQVCSWIAFCKKAQMKVRHLKSEKSQDYAQKMYFHEFHLYFPIFWFCLLFSNLFFSYLRGPNRPEPCIGWHRMRGLRTGWTPFQFPHSCVCERFTVFPGSVHIFSCSRIGRPNLEICKSLTHIGV